MSQVPRKSPVHDMCSIQNALACISEAWSCLLACVGRSVTEQCVCPTHSGCKQSGCDISTGWVTDAQLYKVAFMTAGEDLCDIWVS